MEGLTLNVDTHEYAWQGTPVPGISKIIQTLKLSKDMSFVDPYYAQRGIATHKAIELYLKSNLDELSLDEAYRGYFEAFKKWWQDKKASKIQAIEESLYSERLAFGGTLDLVYDDMIIDYKTSKDVDPATELQGAAQQILFGEYKKVILPFRVLQLFKDGTFKFVDYDPISPNLWDGVMELYRWYKKAHPRAK